VDPVERMLEEVWNKSDCAISQKNLRHTLSVLDDTERLLAELRAEARGMLSDPAVDMDLYAKEQEMKGDLIFRLVHGACMDVHQAKVALSDYKRRHRRVSGDA
jgi:hypothetical protein